MQTPKTPLEQLERHAAGPVFQRECIPLGARSEGSPCRGQRHGQRCHASLPINTELLIHVSYCSATQTENPCFETPFAFGSTIIL